MTQRARSYFAIFGALFGFRNFGRLVAIDNTFNGLIGLLQVELAFLALHSASSHVTSRCVQPACGL
jgi:hypothetical protein